MERIKNVLDEMYINYDIHDTSALIEFWTDTAGQDIPTEFDFDGTAEDFVKQFTESAENYDVDEEMKIYIPMLGKNGCPDTTEELLADMKEAKNTLMEIACKLNKAIDNNYVDPYVLKREKILKYVKEDGPFIFNEEDGFDAAVSTMIGNVIDYAMSKTTDDIADCLENIIPWVNSKDLEEILN
jgi:hypothetical protein